jgi:gas vesicle protein
MLRCSLEAKMADNVGSKVSYFLVGLGVGALVGVLFAPKSGEETRKFLSDKADDGRDFAQKKARELRERADDLVERGKDAASRHKETISAAVEGARDAYRREASKS